MPYYDYHCAANGEVVEVFHRMDDTVSTWGELCARAGLERGETPADAPVERWLPALAVRTPAGDSKLKDLGFTKLVKRDKGVYENVTARDGEKRYVRADDPGSMPNFKRTVGD